MTNRQIAKALLVLAPGASWVLYGDDLAGLIWQDQAIQRPTDAAITAEIAKLQPQANSI